jgi:hypothetical protein
MNENRDAHNRGLCPSVAFVGAGQQGTGYPLAFVAAKLGLGYGLFDL